MSVEAGEVTVVVYGARHLPTKKKGKRKYSVIFGVGHSKFRTDVVQDFFGNPDWNNESQITVENPEKPLLLVVTEKEEILGQVSLNLSDLSTSRPNKQVKARLQPHKKCPDPEGELLYETWISKTRAAEDTVSLKEPQSSGKFRKLKGRLSHSPLLRRKFSGASSSNGKVTLDTSEPLPGMGPKSSQSNFELGPNTSYSSLKGSSSRSMYSINTLGNPDASMQRHYGSFKDLTEEDDDRPEVSGISPKEGPVEGGTRITIRGANLGMDKADVVGLLICGANCLGSLEYESSRKLYATTKLWKPCTGNIVVETQMGGKGTSLVQFTYVESQPKLEVPPATKESKSPSLLKKPMAPPRRSLTPSSSDRSLSETPDTATDAQKSPPPPLFTPSSDEYATPVVEPAPQEEKTPPQPLFTSSTDQTKSDFSMVEKQKTPPPPLFQMEEDKTPHSSSMFDLDASGEADPSTKKQSASTFYDITFIEDKDDDDFPPPEVSGIRPREGPVDGGTRLTIRGKNLGVDKDDIVGLYVCGADCLSTLHYESPSKIHCTTKTWRASTGPIIVETQSGGKGSSLVEYTFKQTDSPDASDLGDATTKDSKLGYPASPKKGPAPAIPAKEPVYATYPRESPPAGVPQGSNTLPRSNSQNLDVEQNNNSMDAGDSPTIKPRKSSVGNLLARLSGSNQDKRQSSPKRELNTDAGTVPPVLDETTLKKLAEFEGLQAENSNLKQQNANMKSYIDDLVSRVIVLCPDALCVDDGRPT